LFYIISLFGEAGNESHFSKDMRQTLQHIG
jgi:hypothetical protein